MRTVVRVMVGAFAMALAGHASADAQESRLARVPEPARAQLDATLVAARSDGLPTEPLVDRALEGAAKGARSELIIAAVNRLLNELRQARVAFGDRASAAELTAGASALRAGASSEDLARLRKLRPDHALTIPAGVLADLVAAGVPADTGIAAVLALASNAADADYVTFRRNVERDIALGASPSASVGARLRAVGELATDSGSPTIGVGSGSGTRDTPRKRKP